MRSLRLRLVLGWLFWTCGLLALAHMVFLAFAGRLVFSMKFSRPGVAVAALAMMGAGLLLVRRGVSPLRMLQARLLDVREGRALRLEGSYPSEIQPLVTDLNALLDHREKAVRRAVVKAGDLAHGLKTPLAVLAREAERVVAEGRGGADVLREQVDRMSRQVDYHLAHARAAASGAAPGARCLVAESAEGVARALRTLHAERGLVIDVSVPSGLTVRAGREDLDEMLGNLLENGCKWGRARISVSCVLRDGVVECTVDDDGPGLALALRESVLQRGVRADERAPGSGLGLSIARELAEVYGGSITLGDAPRGGLRAVLRLPA